MNRVVTLTGTRIAALAGAGLAVAGAGALISFSVATDRAMERNRQYQELTRKLSADVSELTKSCERDRKRIDDEKMTAVRALPSAAAAVRALDEELEKAKTKRDADTRAGHAAALAATHNADLTRRERNEAADRNERESNFRADDAVAEERRKAKQKYDAEMERISRMPSEAQPNARQAALAAYNEALKSAQDAHRRAQVEHRRDQQRARERAADEEATTVRRAKEQAQWAAEAAKEEFQAQVEAAQLRFQTAVTLLPDASPILAAAIERRRMLDAGCTQSDRDLRAAFRRAADALRPGAGDGVE
jgi:hypothetical protein